MNRRSGKKVLVYLLPVLLALLLRIVFRIIDRYFVDGNGIIEHPMMEKTIFSTDILAILVLLFALLKEVLRFSAWQAIFNILFIIVVLYLVEWWLYKTDLFYQSPFDSYYYFNNYFIYKKKMPLNFNPREPIITWGNEVRNNAYGFRERNFNTLKPDSVFRIMVLGDSFTWGAGLSENQRYSNQLEDMLKRHFNNVEVLNFGIPGGPTIAERDTLLKYKSLVQPNWIIVGFCFNDLQPKGQDHVEKKKSFQNRYGHIICQIKNHLGFLWLHYVADRLERFFYQILEKTGIIPTWQVELNKTYDLNSVEWKAFIQALQDIKNVSDSLGCPPPIFAPFNTSSSLISMFVPGTDEISKQELSWLHQVRGAADSIGFITIDFWPSFYKAVQSGRLHKDNLIVMPLDGHPSAEMNKIYAEELYEVVLPVVTQYFNKQ